MASVRILNSKNRIILSVLPLLIILMSACGQKDPVGIGGATGSIYVTSSVSGAAIILDGDLRSEVTPDTLDGIPIGEHVVAISLEGYEPDPQVLTIIVQVGRVETASFALVPQSTGLQRVVLLEDFSNTGCIPCVAADSIVTELLRFYGPDQLIGIQYHVYWPYPGDPFYLAAMSLNNARTSYYGVNNAGVPFVVLDGLLSPGATDGSAVQQAIEERLAVESLVELRTWNDVVGSSGQVGAEIICPSEPPAGSLRLHLVVLESNILYDASNGLDHFDNIMRVMLPGASGISISLTAGDTLTFNEDYTVDADWAVENLSVVAFIQDESTREIIQAASNLNP
ncbi:MAG: hypothetical protein A2Z06_02910 [Candidatus Glassbacteria bacterium RBG_16_58_8]|uniref:PEGA domain-containing protein n=1 Tax=Candidatus Glassbacteria bacterium RBG_16_58_8 TaxID=1817866 RepID=A0A1F5YCK2_9BACT|nr:MAG: hypothetical protein A2Z06_02910 [Candidatus Glassbacteria bacterium RBG_16_58_8]